MKIITLLLIAFLTGCATEYQPNGFTGGFSETQLGENVFRVSFRGNGHTSTERAADFSMLRAAEITLENGFKYFIVVDSKDDASLSTFTTPTTSQTTASAYGVGNHAYGTAYTTTNGGNTFIISRPRVANTIVCFKEKPEDKGIVYDADFLVDSIKKKYDLQ